MRGKKTDRVELHERFFKDSDRTGRITIYQKELAAQLGVTQATMSLIIKNLTDEGRIRKISAKRANVGLYVVRDPALFEHEFVPRYVPGIGIDRCGKCGEIRDNGPHTPPRASAVPIYYNR